MSTMISEIPVLFTPITGTVLSTLISALFVFGLYLFNSSTDRDNPTVIKQRIKSVIVTTILSLIFLYFILPSSENKLTLYFNLIGISFSFNYFFYSFIPLLLTMILFIGPIIMDRLDEIELDVDYNLQSLRDYIVGPSVEEFVFRSVIGPIFYFSGVPINTIIIFSPFLFGFAHIHHVFVSKGKLPIKILSCIVKITYTSIFGMYSAFLFFRTGNVLSCILAHSFCNVMGVPNFQGVLYNDNKYIVMACYVVGLIGFFCLLFPLTDPSIYNSIYYSK